MLKKLFKSSGVQTKLIALVLTASLATILITGLLSFGVARHLLAETGYERLTALRSTQAAAVHHYLEELANHVMTLSEASMTADAAKAFIGGFNELPDINDKQKKDLKTYYENEFIPKLKRLSGVEIDPPLLTSKQANQRYLKYHYVAANNSQHLDTSVLEDAKDGSTWSRIHSNYHRRFRRYAKLFGYEDIMLVDIKTGNVVYNVSKEDDLGTNLLSGPYANTPAARVFQEVKRSKDPFFITFSDFTNYSPSFGKPTMFVGTSVFDGDDFIAALIFQLSNERIDKLMTTNRKWDRVGMGNSGETYLVGEDLKFRSSPRFFLENSKTYLEQAQRHGLTASQVEAIRNTDTPVLVQTVNTPGSRNALAGRSGTASFRDYRGVPVVSSYQPIRFGPFEWALLAEIDQAELFSGIGHLARTLLLLAALLIPAMAFLTLRMARAFIRPIRRLQAATDQISAGDYNIKIPVKAHDEFGDLATAFNAMSAQLSQREDSLKEQVAENQRLLLSILPGSAASRLRQGARAMAETHPNVSVLFAHIEGWEELSQRLPAKESIRLLKELTGTLEATGERFGVEKLQIVGTTYLAVSGLSRARSDHEKRAVDAALAMEDKMRRFNTTHNTSLSLDIGLHAGPLTTGVLSGERLSFDIWGHTINIARTLHESAKHNGVRVSAPIVEALRGLYSFQPLSPIPLKDQGEMAVWEVVGAGQAAD